MNRIVKRRGHNEEFDKRKIYASVFAACMTLRMTDEEGELLANTVTKEAVDSFKDIHELSSRDIHKKVAQSLGRLHPDAGYMYDTHKDIS